MKHPEAMRAAARELVRRLDALGTVSDERGRLTRTFLSPAMRRANRQVGQWMRAAGLAVREDGIGNLVGRREGADPRAGTLLIGSHLDTVRDAGRFDGALGVLLGCAVAEVLRAEQVRLPFALEIVGFSEEEGVRFASGYLGSKGFFGRLTAADLARRDAKGVRVGDLISRQRRVSAKHYLGYFEAHIEQGPVLEDAGLPVGVVSGIAGQTRGCVIFTGKAGHAGTTPMRLRRDALAGAAEWLSAVERLARQHPPLVATVGSIAALPGAPNVIPAQAHLSLDVRHPRDAARTTALRTILARGAAIARRRQLAFHWERTQHDGAVACDARLTRLAAACIAAEFPGRAPRALVSGAGHDAVAVSAVAPVAMLFVRCRDGLSHHPAEYARPADIAAALRVACSFVRGLAAC